MRLLLVAFLVTLVAAASAGTLSEDEKAFSLFIMDYKRVYASAEEREMRFEAFRKNVRKAEEMQKLHGDGATFGVTHFSDWTDEELAALHPPLPLVDKKTLPMAPSLPLVDLESEWTWKGTSRVRSVKNQGSCGSCWAFATAGEAEGQFQSGDLSTQQLLDCVSGAGCHGGWPGDAYDYVIEAGGWDSWNSYPYEFVQGQCRYSPASRVYGVNGWGYVPGDFLMLYLRYHGPVQGLLDARGLEWYQKGRLEPSACPTPEINHAVVLVGWETFNNNVYFIVKNSWGWWWAEDGYFRIRKDACMISEWGGLVSW